MERMNKYMFLAENDNEFESFLKKNVRSYIDVISYLKYISKDEANNLFYYIVSKLEYLDDNNIILDYNEIKKELGIVGNFVIDINQFSNKKDINSINLNEKALSLDNEKANEKCKQINSELSYLLSKIIID